MRKIRDSHRAVHSRLSDQLTLSAGPDGVRVSPIPED